MFFKRDLFFGWIIKRGFGGVELAYSIGLRITDKLIIFIRISNSIGEF